MPSTRQTPTFPAVHREDPIPPSPRQQEEGVDQKKSSAEKVDHVFHESCLLEWGKQKATCPTCRLPITHINGTPIWENNRELPISPYFSLLAATQAGDTETLQELLGQGIGCDHRSSALIEAAKHGREAAALLLLEEGETDPVLSGLAVSGALKNGHENIAIQIMKNRPVTAGFGAYALQICAENNLLHFARFIIDPEQTKNLPPPAHNGDYAFQISAADHRYRFARFRPNRPLIEETHLERAYTTARATGNNEIAALIHSNRSSIHQFFSDAPSCQLQ